LNQGARENWQTTRYNLPVDSQTWY